MTATFNPPGAEPLDAATPDPVPARVTVVSGREFLAFLYVGRGIYAACGATPAAAVLEAWTNYTAIWAALASCRAVALRADVPWPRPAVLP